MINSADSGRSRPPPCGDDLSFSSLDKQEQQQQSLRTFRTLGLEHLLRTWPLGGCSGVTSEVWDRLGSKTTITSQYDIFLSHAWESSSWLKIAALAIRYNSEGAVVVSILECYILQQWCGLAAYLCIIIPCIIFPFCLRWGTIRGGAFFDRCCIPQGDVQEKNSCLLAMPEYLARSKKLISMWDEAYQSRLWCIFELAVFVKQHGINCIEVWTLRSVEFGTYFFCTSLVFWVGHSVVDDANELAAVGVDLIFSFIHTIYVSFCFYPCIKRYLKHGIVMGVERLRCSLTCDRHVLLAHIRALYGNYTSFDQQVVPLMEDLILNMKGAPFALRLTIAAILPSTLATYITGRIVTAIVVGVFPNFICFGIALTYSHFGSRHSFLRKSIFELERVFACALVGVIGVILLYFTRTWEVADYDYDGLHLAQIPVQIAVSIMLISVLTRFTFAY